jgi:tagatose 6-phosphate kinase
LILTVTLNLALDITYHVKHFERGATTRIEGLSRQAGGKGVNVARVLLALGREVAVTGFAGGFPGLAARAELNRAGLHDELVQISGESRLTIVVAEADGRATGFSEVGPNLASGEWAVFRARFAELVGGAEAVVLSGSLPRGVPVEAYGELIAAASAAGVPAILDTGGAVLEHGVAAGPAIVAINRAELASVAGDVGVVAGARELRRAGAEAVVVSHGPAGLLGVADGVALQAAPPEALTGNPTGAGDAVTAALVAGLLDGLAWPERLVDAAALSAAAVRAPLAGSFDETVYRELRGQIVARTVH